MPRDKEKKRLSLSFIVCAVVAVILVAFILIFYFIINTTATNMLLDAETKYLTEQTGVVNGLVEGEANTMYSMAYDVAIWSKSADFANGLISKDDFESEWPNMTMLETYQYNFVFIKDLAGNDILSQAYDFINASNDLAFPEGLSAHLNGISEKIIAKNRTAAEDGNVLEFDDMGMLGVTFFGDTPYLIGAMPIKADHSEKEVYGSVIFCDVLDMSYFNHLSHFNTVTIEIEKANLSEEGTGVTIEREDKNKAVASKLIVDAEGGSAWLVVSDTRAIFNDGNKAMNLALGLMIGAVTLLIILVYLLIIRLVLRPIVNIGKELQNIEKRDFQEIDIERFKGNSEFYTLATSINDMLGKLNQSKISLNVFQNIINGIDAYIYVSDPETDELLFINDKMMEHFGFDESTIGKTCWKVMQPEGTEERCKDCPISQIKESGSADSWESFNKRTGRYYRNNDILIDWAGGRTVHLQHSVDITDMKFAEDQIKAKLDQQELMTAMAQSFISSENIDDLIQKAIMTTGKFLSASKIVISKIEYKNNRIGYKYGWKADGVKSELGVTNMPFDKSNVFYQKFYEEKYPYIICNDLASEPEFAVFQRFGIKSMIAMPIFEGGVLWGAITIDDCDKPRDWSSSDIHLVKLVASVISGAVGRDKTEKKLTMLSSIVEKSPQYMSYIDASGKFAYLNQGALDITGYTMEELAEGGSKLMLTSECFDELISTYGEEYYNAQFNNLEMTVTRKDGEERTVLLSAFPSGLKEGGQGATGIDITEKRRLEKELVDAKELAEQSSRAKGDFLSRMSHEMRTPMNAIIGMTNIAQHSHDMDKKEYCLTKISEASTHLLGVINDILDMSKIEANKFELVFSEFSFERMLMRVSNVINFKIDEKHQNFIVNIERDVPHHIICDEQRLSQVITNLLSNATKFTPENGTITLSIKCESEVDGVCGIRVEVKDTGIGISEEQISRLFQRFEQADGGISRKFGGTGLGLAISKSIVEMLGGKIWVESEVGVGSKFIFTFDAKSVRDETKVPLLDNSVNWKNLRVLAVDDSGDVLDYFETISEVLKFRCDVAHDGRTACDIIDMSENEPYNIIFVDWKMPDMDGIEVTKHIKAKKHKNTVVIMISAHEWSDIEQEAKAAGVDKFVPKPLFMSLIVDCINECLGVKKDQKDEEVVENWAGKLKGKKVLLAEDIDINREIVYALVEDTGLEIDSAENGKIACEMFAKNPNKYDMIFMDIHMPEMDGYEATRVIRSLSTPRAKEIPIVAMTANVFKEDIEKCLAAGMNDHIGKPLDTEELFRKFRVYLLGEKLPKEEG